MRPLCGPGRAGLGTHTHVARPRVPSVSFCTSPILSRASCRHACKEDSWWQQTAQCTPDETGKVGTSDSWFREGRAGCSLGRVCPAPHGQQTPDIWQGPQVSIREHAQQTGAPFGTQVVTVALGWPPLSDHSVAVGRAARTASVQQARPLSQAAPGAWAPGTGPKPASSPSTLFLEASTGLARCGRSLNASCVRPGGGGISTENSQPPGDEDPGARGPAPSLLASPPRTVTSEGLPGLPSPAPHLVTFFKQNDSC